MRENKSPSSLKIILMGELIVNFPVVLVIVISTILFVQIGLGGFISMSAAFILGWLTWSKLLDYWIKWALNRNTERDKLYRLGKLGLINFYRYRIMEGYGNKKEGSEMENGNSDDLKES